MLQHRFATARRPYLDEERARAELDALHRRGADAVFELCVEMRGGVLKIGQILASRADLLPAPYIERLSQLACFEAGETSVEEVTVFASRLRREGPAYHVLSRARLARFAAHRRCSYQLT